MGGALKVVRSESRETRFELVLPALKPRAAAPVAAARERLSLAPQPGMGLVLVVEDEAAIRSAIKRTLTNVGYSVLEASDGVAAQALMLQHGTGVSLLISDSVLPQGSGPELAVWARATCPNAAFLLISGRQRAGEVEASSVGAHFLAKPFYPAELLAAVRHVISRARVAAEVKEATPQHRVVLVVDDETDILDSFERLLGECDFETLVTKSGVQALQILNERHIDAVIADQFMPGLDGIGLLELVHERFPGTTRILCTGHPASDIVIAAVNRGRVHRVLAKTMHAVALRDEIERAVVEGSLQE
jgi:DNA-binding NtrC family response regulator